MNQLCLNVLTLTTLLRIMELICKFESKHLQILLQEKLNLGEIHRLNTSQDNNCITVSDILPIYRIKL